MEIYARDLNVGDAIDLLSALKAYATTLEESTGYENDISAYELAVVESIESAVPVNGEDAILLYTDQHIIKLPALYLFDVERA